MIWSFLPGTIPWFEIFFDINIVTKIFFWLVFTLPNFEKSFKTYLCHDILNGFPVYSIYGWSWFTISISYLVITLFEIYTFTLFYLIFIISFLLFILFLFILFNLHLFIFFWFLRVETEVIVLRLSFLHNISILVL